MVIDLQVRRPKRAKNKAIEPGMRLFLMPENDGVLEARHRAPAKNREYMFVGYAVAVERESKVLARIIF